MTTRRKVTKKKATRKKATKKTTTRRKVTKKKATKKKTTRTTLRTKKKATKKVTRKTTKKATKKKGKTKRKPNAAFMRAMQPSEALSGIVGSRPLPRTQAVKRIWDHIKKHKLQNPANKRNILSDDLLRKLSGKSEFSMFELAKIVNEHLQ